MVQIEIENTKKIKFTYHLEKLEQTNDPDLSRNLLIKGSKFVLSYLFFKNLINGFEKENHKVCLLENDYHYFDLFVEQVCGGIFKFTRKEKHLTLFLKLQTESKFHKVIIPENFIVNLANELNKENTLTNERQLVELYTNLTEMEESLRESKKGLGIYYTSMPITELMSSEVLSDCFDKSPFDEISILDSSCGIGNFLVASLRILISKLHSLGLKEDHFKEKVGNILRNQLSGFDLDPFAIIICKLRLLATIFEETLDVILIQTCLEDLSRTIQNEDFLQVSNVLKPKIIIGNPPWGKIMQSDYKKSLLKHFKFQHGQVDMYRLFLEICIKLDPDYLCLITPNSWLEIPSAKALKKVFFEKRNLITIFLFPSDLFPISAHFFGFISLKNTELEKSPRNINIVKVKNKSPNVIELRKEQKASSMNNFSLKNLNVHEKETIEIIELLRSSDSYISLGDLIDVTIGYQLYHNSIHTPDEIATRKYHATSEINEHYIREITSKDLRMYSIDRKTRSFVNKQATFFRVPPKRFFESDKLLMREILSKEGFIVAKVPEEVFYPKTILGILLKEQNSEKRLLALLGFFVSYVCQFEFLNNGIKASRKLFPRISIQSLKSLHFTESIFTSGLEVQVKNLINSYNKKEQLEVYRVNYAQLQAKIFVNWNINASHAKIIMNYLRVSYEQQDQISKAMQKLVRT